MEIEIKALQKETDVSSKERLEKLEKELAAFERKDDALCFSTGFSVNQGVLAVVAQRGDYIICDGIRGKVSSINYTSTVIDALDGSTIAFQNSQLFTKNYKNMTKNDGYEVGVIEVGVAYGTNVKEVRELLIDAIAKLGITNENKDIIVRLKSFDDSCITLKILVWLNVLTQGNDISVVMECIYDTLNNNGIEIPFPQREITIKHQQES